MLNRHRRALRTALRRWWRIDDAADEVMERLDATHSAVAGAPPPRPERAPNVVAQGPGSAEAIWGKGFAGAGDGIRTRGLRITNALLYRRSDHSEASWVKAMRRCCSVV